MQKMQKLKAFVDLQCKCVSLNILRIGPILRFLLSKNQKVP